MNLKQNLDIILEDSQQEKWHPFEAAEGLLRELDTAKQRISDIEYQLNNIKRRMSADLALSIRRTKPGLNIALDKHGCKVGYKTKYLQFIPDVEQGMWKVLSANRRFEREFLNLYRRSTLMIADLSPIVSAIIDYFTNHYRTLGESILGTGILLLEDRKTTLVDIAQWRTDNQPALRSRLMRQVIYA